MLSARTQAERSAQTRATFVRVARALFASKGYALTSTGDILAAAGLTRGAMYHHFAGKAALFEAVCVQIHEEIAREIMSAASLTGDPWEDLQVGCDAFLDAAGRPDVQRIVLVDGPSVLGWDRWRELDRAHGFGLLIDGVDAAAAAGFLRAESSEVIAAMLNGAINDGVSWAVRSRRRRAERLDDVRKVLHRFLGGLRSGSDPPLRV